MGRLTMIATAAAAAFIGAVAWRSTLQRYFSAIDEWRRERIRGFGAAGRGLAVAARRPLVSPRDA